MLFNIDDIEAEEELFKFKRHEDKISRFITENVRLEIDVQMGALTMGESIHYATTARWHLHDIIVWALRQTGPADIYIGMFSIKEYQARILDKMKAAGIITKIHCLVDYRIEVRDASVMAFLKEMCDSIGQMRTHSKLVVIRNETWGITITGSGNLTQNTRADVGVITCDTSVADYRIDWILKNINDGNRAK